MHSLILIGVRNFDFDHRVDSIGAGDLLLINFFGDDIEQSFGLRRFRFCMSLSGSPMGLALGISVALDHLLVHLSQILPLLGQLDFQQLLRVEDDAALLP